MRAINHALTGAVIGLAIGKPVIAIPAAIVSHYALDVIPHFGIRKDDHLKEWFRYVLVVDALLCVLLVGVLYNSQVENWLLAIVCAFLAAAPDLLSINKYMQGRRGKPWKPGLYVRFASRIQWFERPSGLVVEIVWLIAMSTVLYTQLH